MHVVVAYFAGWYDEAKSPDPITIDLHATRNPLSCLERLNAWFFRLHFTPRTAPRIAGKYTIALSIWDDISHNCLETGDNFSTMLKMI